MATSTWRLYGGDRDERDTSTADKARGTACLGGLFAVNGVPTTGEAFGGHDVSLLRQFGTRRCGCHRSSAITRAERFQLTCFVADSAEQTVGHNQGPTPQALSALEDI